MPYFRLTARSLASASLIHVSTMVVVIPDLHMATLHRIDREFSGSRVAVFQQEGVCGIYHLCVFHPA
jgi:hypothetical protein